MSENSSFRLKGRLINKINKYVGSLKFVINSEIRDFFELPTCSRDETLCMLDQFVVNPTKKKTLDLILAEEARNEQQMNISWQSLI